MKEQFKDFPICVNCKFYLEEKTGPLQIAGTCGLTTVDPVTGDYQGRRQKIKLAAAFRKDGMPCGVGGSLFQPGKKKVTPKKKPIVVEEPKESTAKVIEVDTPLMVDENKSMHGVDKAAITKDNPILGEEPKKRRRRSK
jgi:hypothetical protein